MGTPPTKARRHCLVFLGLLIAYTLDMIFVVVPYHDGIHPYTFWVTSLTNDLRANVRRPDVAVLKDQSGYHLLYGAGATAHLQNNANAVYVSVRPPYPQEHGLVTPFYAICTFNFEVTDFDTDIPREEADRLRGEYLARVSADPFYSRLSSLSRAALASPATTITEVSWPLAVHDLLFILGLPLLALRGYGVLSPRIRALRQPKLGCCRNCSYSLAGLRSDSCPECGTPIPR